MAAQKAKARAAWAGSGEMADDTIWFDVLDNHGATDFLGYDTEQAEGQIVALVQDGAQVDRADAGAAVQIVHSTKRLSMRKAAVRSVTAARSLQRAASLRGHRLPQNCGSVHSRGQSHQRLCRNWGRPLSSWSRRNAAHVFAQITRPPICCMKLCAGHSVSTWRNAGH